MSAQQLQPKRTALTSIIQGHGLNFFTRILAGFKLLEPGKLKLKPAPCPFCGPSIFIRLNATEAGVRCVRCAASTVHLSIGLAVQEQNPDVSRLDVYELSASGPWVRYLANRSKSARFSEYIPELPSGSTAEGGIRSEDVQALSWPDHCFDLITHTEIFEHVADDRAGFRELHRVLKPGGWMYFTIPLHGHPNTVERALIRDHQIEYLLPAEYHTDPFNGGKPVLVFRDYGRDIIQRLEEAGFSDIQIEVPSSPAAWIKLRPVIRACA